MSTYFAIISPSQNELYHFGIKGMKWGIRHDPRNGRYSDDDRRLDKQMYGRRAVKRINRRMNQGVSLGDARAIEGRRLIKAKKALKKAGAVGAGIGGFIGLMAGSDVAHKVNRDIKQKTGIDKWIRADAPGDNAGLFRKVGYYAQVGGRSALYNRFIGRYPDKLLSAAGTYVGGKIGRKVGRGAYMLYSGYSPRHFR